MKVQNPGIMLDPAPSAPSLCPHLGLVETSTPLTSLGMRNPLTGRNHCFPLGIFSEQREVCPLKEKLSFTYQSQHGASSLRRRDKIIG